MIYLSPLVDLLLLLEIDYITLYYFYNLLKLLPQNRLKTQYCCRNTWLLTINYNVPSFLGIFLTFNKYRHKYNIQDLELANISKLERLPNVDLR